MVKEYLSHKGVDFEEKDISIDAEAREEMFNRTKRMAVPTLIIGGEVVIGFDENRLNKLLH
ncbi:MAG: hypothetical protein PWP31_1928 [Clostridia bacterium]|nr:hypothetical protein [Clostridia bacterium]